MEKLRETCKTDKYLNIKFVSKNNYHIWVYDEYISYGNGRYIILNWKYEIKLFIDFPINSQSSNVCYFKIKNLFDF